MAETNGQTGARKVRWKWQEVGVLSRSRIPRPVIRAANAHIDKDVIPPLERRKSVSQKWVARALPDWTLRKRLKGKLPCLKETTRGRRVLHPARDTSTERTHRRSRNIGRVTKRVIRVDAKKAFDSASCAWLRS